MPLSDFLVILNPAAGRGSAVRAWPSIERALRAAGARFQLVRTEAPRHATALAEQAAREGRSAVVAVGGDGVVHEVANGLLRASGGAPTLPFGVIGAGTGNDFVKLLGPPVQDARAAVARLLEAKPVPFDVGRVTRCVAESAPEGEWYFTNGIGLGFDAQVAVEASRIRRLRGLAVYGWALVRTLRTLRAPHVRVSVDGRVVADQPLVLTTVANGPCHGGSFWLCPNARPDDGVFDVLVADARGVVDVLRLVPRVMRGAHLGDEGVQLHRAKRVEIRSREPLPLHADGEIVAAGVTEISVEIDTGRLTVLA